MNLTFEFKGIAEETNAPKSVYQKIKKLVNDSFIFGKARRAICRKGLDVPRYFLDRELDEVDQ